MPTLLLIDDVDALLARVGDDHQQPFVDMLLELLRSGGAAGVHLVMASRRLGGAVQALSTACDSQLLLRLQSRQDHLIAGGDASLFSVDAVAGRGEWRGAAVQVAMAEGERGPDPMPGESISPDQTVFDPTRWPTVLAISGSPRDLCRRLEPHAEVRRLDEPEVVATDRPLVIVGDVEGWSSAWQRMSRLRPSAALLFDRCSIAEFRTISGQRRLPPPIEQHSGSAWLLEPDGRLSRVKVHHDGATP